MNLLVSQDWSFPIPIAYGPGRLREISVFCTKAGMSRPLIVTDSGSRDLPFVSEMHRSLHNGGLKADIFHNISPNPRDEEIALGRRQFHDGCHDGVIALGGGSGMDGGKAICLVARNDHGLWSFEYEKTPPGLSGKDFPPLICVPTTAGTGAETESTAMVTETARMMKLCVWHPALKPSFAILDPEVTLALPETLTAWTGCDALVHALEAYCVPGFHPMCDGVALEALRLVSTWLPVAVSEPDNLQARSGMLVGSCLAGVAFLKGLGLVHAISHMVGAAYDTHHGLTNAVVLPAVLRFNAPAITDRVPHLAGALGLKDTAFDSLYGAICSLLDHLEIPKTLQAIGVPGDCARGLAQKASLDSAAATNPRQATVEEITAVIEEALSFGR